MAPEIDIKSVSRAVQKALADLYGNRLEAVMLYGSYARGDFHDESDIDFLVVLRDETVNAYEEVFAMGPVIFPIQLRFGICISTHAISLRKFRESDFSFVENVRRDGVAV